MREVVSREGKEVRRRRNSKKKEGCQRRKTTNFNTKNKATILKSIINKIGQSKVTYFEGVTLDAEINIQQAVAAAKNKDVIVVCLGELPCTEKPGDI